MTLLKSALQTLARASVRGRSDGLSPIGCLLEKYGNYARFVTQELRQEYRHTRPPPVEMRGSERVPAGSLAYDIGANNGEDTAFYLKKGMNVIAVEANPDLAANLAKRYAREITAGRVDILNCAIVDDDRPDVEFFVHKSNDKISTVVAPTDMQSEFRMTRVRAIRLSHLIKQHGDPYFVKIDIEGTDGDVLRDLISQGIRPRLISAEAHSVEVLALLIAGGYNRFKIVEGRFVHTPYYEGAYKDSSGCEFHHAFAKCETSGPFGDDIPGPWLTADQMFEYLATHGLGWKDIHATWRAA